MNTILIGIAGGTGSGKTTLTRHLKEHFGKDVTVIGAAVRAEIWDTARWNAYNESQTDEAIEASMNLLDF